MRAYTGLVLTEPNARNWIRVDVKRVSARLECVVVYLVPSNIDKVEGVGVGVVDGTNVNVCEQLYGVRRGR